MKKQAAAALLLLIAFFPVLNWYHQRLGNGGGESLGLLALALAITLAVKQRGAPNARLAEISLIVYVIGLFLLPPLLRAIPALATVAFLTGMHRRAGLLGLLLLSLPVQASLAFFLGYPFRIITAEGANYLLNCLGYPVDRLGVQLSLKSIIVSVDHPCSGLQMLWASAFLTAVLSALFQLNYRRSIFLGLVSLVLCLFANILRAGALFFPEAGIVTLSDFAHEGIGLAFFALASLALVMVARKLHHRKIPQNPTSRPVSRRFIALACGVTLTTFLPAHTSPPAPQVEILLTSYQGRPVEEVALGPREKSFARNFPGQLKIYRVGADTLIVRRVTRASRMLHPSYHCLTAEGFKISNSQIRQDGKARPFLSYQATRRDESFLVSEKIRSLNDDQQWTEISAWYWYALFHPTSGPWEAETLMTPISKTHE